MWQTASDFLIFLGWTWQNVTAIVKGVFLPVQYVYTFLQSFVTTAIATPPTGPEIWSFDNDILAIFSIIPYWNILILSLVFGVTILMIIFILKTFLKS